MQIQFQANVENNSPIVEGVNTTFTQDVEVGQAFAVVGDYVTYTIASVDNNTQITLSAPYQGNTVSGAQALVVTDYTNNYSLPEIARGDLESGAIYTRAVRRIDDVLGGLGDSENISYDPSGLLESENVQDALDELGVKRVIPLPDVATLSSLDADSLVDGQQFSVQDSDKIRLFTWNAGTENFDELPVVTDTDNVTGAGTVITRDTGTDMDQVPLNTNIVYPLQDIAELSGLDTAVLLDGQQFSVKDGDKIRYFAWNEGDGNFDELPVDTSASNVEGAGTAITKDTGTEMDQIPLNVNIVYPLPDIAALSSLNTATLVDGQQFSVEDGDRVRFFKWTPSENDFSELILSPDIVTTEQFGGDAASVQRAIDYAESSGILNVLVTESHDMQGAVLEIPSGMTFKCRTGAVLNNCRVVASGSHGSEVSLTTALAPGERVFSVSDSSGFSVGDDVRLVSAINCGSGDAGYLRLGDRVADNSHFAEFGEILDINGNEITLADPVLWDYPLTGGTDSNNLNNSVLIPITFNTAVNIDVNLTWAGVEYPLELFLCKNALATGNVESSESGCAEMLYCYNSHFEGGNYRHTVDGVTNAQTIPVKLRSCQGCSLRSSAEVTGGHQGFDVTYQVNDSDLYGGPSMFCKCLDSTFRGQTTDAIVTHEGCYATEIAGNTGYCRNNGVRIRSKMDNVHDNFMYGLDDGGNNAYFAASPLLEGSQIRDNFASNFTACVTQDKAPLYDYSAAVCVRNNTSAGCNFGYRTTTAIGAHNLLFGTVVEDNTWMSHPPYKEFARGVTLARYSNGMTVSGNRSFGATEFGVKYDTNTVGLEIVGNKSYDQGPSASGVSGSSNLGFILDTATFPDGESAANLVIRGNITDGSGLEYGAIIRNSDCYRQVAEWGWSNFSQPIARGFADNIERSSINIYVDDSVSPRELRARFHDGDSSYDVLLSEYGT